jgi:hypothetical protein
MLNLLKKTMTYPGFQLHHLGRHNKLLTVFQYGFHRHCSTAVVVLKVTEDIRQSMENCQSVTVLLLLNFSQAFDMVDAVHTSCKIPRTIWLVLVCWWNHISVNEHILWDLVVKNLLLEL